MVSSYLFLIHPKLTYTLPGYIDLGVLTNLRHLTLTFSLTVTIDQMISDNPGIYFSTEPFGWIPCILASCNGHNTGENCPYAEND